MSCVCRICLAGNTRLYSLENNLLIDFYEKLSSTKFYTEDARPRALCCFCYLKLQKCHTFFQIADRSEKIFTQLYHKGLKVTHEYITEVNLRMKPQLTVTTVQTIGNTTNPSSQAIVKHEPVPIVDIKEEATTERDEWVDVESVLDDCTKRSEEDNQNVEEFSYSIHEEETKPDDSKMTTSCNNCDKIFFNESQLLSHIRNSHSQLKGRQHSCTKQYTENTTGMNNKKKMFDCHICDKEFAKKSNLNTHMRTHTGEKPFVCDLCGEKFKRNDYLALHMRTHTKEKPFSCNVCHKKFASKQSIAIHMRNHTGEKPFVCNFCDKKFKQTPHLVSHMRIHTGEKPFPCNVCNKQFSHKKSLDFHMRSHTGAQPFACNVCKKQYKMKSDLVRHMRNHSGGMPFACNVCNKPFNLNRDLVRHMRTHTGEMPFACNECDKTFSLKCNLVKHMRIHT